MYTVYSYWDMAELQAVLNAVVMVMGGDDYLGLLKTFAIVGLLVAVCYGFVRARAEDGAAYLLILGIWYVGLFVPKVDVVIEDRAPATGAPVTVANVPLGLAFFTATTSHIGKFLTDRFETMFSLPSDLRFDTNGLMFGSRILEEMRKSTIADPTLSQDMTSFVKNCLNPELLVNPGLMNTIVNSTDIWDTIYTGASGTMFNPGLAVTLYIPSAGTSQWVDCKTAVLGGTLTGGGTIAAADSLTGRLAGAVTVERQRLGATLNPGVPTATATTLIATQIPAAEGLMLSTSRTAAQGIRQNVMINLMRDTSKTIPQLLNDPSAVQIAVAESMASASANSSYLVMAKMAEGSLPKIRNVIQVIVIAVFPIVMLLIILAGTKGGLVVRSYAMGMFWVQLWAPLYAVLNYISTMAAAKSAKGALTGVAGQSLINAADLASTVLSDQAIAGMMTLSVPMIALALVKGGEVAMSGVVSSVMGPASATAGRAGDQVGQGNISMGNTSWGTHTSNMTSANKWDTNTSFNTGATSVGRGLSTMRSDDTGAVSFDGSALGSNLGKITGSLRNAVSASAAEQSSTSWSRGMEAARSFSTQFQSVLSRARGFETSSGGSSSTGHRESSSAISRIADSARRMASTVEEVAKSSGVESGVVADLALQARAAASAGISLGDWGVKMEGSLVASGRRSDQVKSAIAAAKKVASSQEYGKAFETAQQATDELSKSREFSSGSKATSSIQATSQSSAAALQSASENFRKATSFDQVKREMASSDQTVDMNLASAYVERNGAQAADRLARSPMSEQGAALQEFASSYANNEASRFMQHSPRDSLKPTPIQQEDRSVVQSAESQVRPVDAAGSRERVAAINQQNQAAVPGNSSSTPQEFKSENVLPADTVTQAANAGVQNSERIVGNARGAGEQQYDKAAADSTGLWSAVGAVNNLGGLVGLKLGPAVDPRMNLSDRPVIAPNDGQKPWVSNGRAAEGRITPPNPNKE